MQISNQPAVVRAIHNSPEYLLPVEHADLHEAIATSDSHLAIKSVAAEHFAEHDPMQVRARLEAACQQILTPDTSDTYGSSPEDGTPIGVTDLQQLATDPAAWDHLRGYLESAIFQKNPESKLKQLNSIHTTFEHLLTTVETLRHIAIAEATDESEYAAIHEAHDAAGEHIYALREDTRVHIQATEALIQSMESQGNVIPLRPTQSVKTTNTEKYAAALAAQRSAQVSAGGTHQISAQ